MSETVGSSNRQVTRPVIIDTIKGRRGETPYFVPVDLEGKPLVSGEETGYDQKGKKKRCPSTGRIVDTKA